LGFLPAIGRAQADIDAVLFERAGEFLALGPAIRLGIAKTREATPALLEFITEKAVDVSRFG
jgi:hypothetical protein